jgi:predicted nucleic acid-binding Zn ribbon protein
MIRRSTEISLKDAIEKFLKDFNLDEKLNETRLLGSWEKVAGKLIARHTQEIFVRDQVLYIKADSAALKQELTYMRSKLMEKLNKTAGQDVIKDIKLL